METTVINVTLEGLADLMFDRFVSHSKDVKPPEQKIYIVKGNVLVMPSENIWSFLFRQKKPVGCIKKFEAKQSANFLSFGESHLAFMEPYYPILHKGKQVVVGKEIKEPMYIHEANPVTQTSGGVPIKQETIYRPCLRLPWSIPLRISLIKNSVIDEEKLRSYFEKGGLLVALGAYRPRHGRFYVKDWTVEK